MNGKAAREVFVDRGYRGIKKYKSTNIHVPQPDKAIRQTKRRKHSRRAAIEEVIWHMKRNYRLGKNYLNGIRGDKINAILATAAMNFKRFMNLAFSGKPAWKLIYHFLIDVCWKYFTLKLKPTF